MASFDPEQLGELLSAYLDGELEAREVARVESLLQQDASARQLLEELRRTVSLVAELPRHTAPPSIAEDVRAHVERGELLGDFDRAPSVAPGRRSSALRLLSMAAMIGFVVVAAAIWYVRDREHSAAGPGHDVVAMAPAEGDEAERHEQLAPESRAFPKKSRVSRTSKRGREKGPAPLSRTPAPAKRAMKGPTTEGPEIEEAGQKDARRRSSSAVGVAQFADTDLLAAVTLDQKLLTAVTVERLREHAFANEPVRLRVVASDAAGRDAVARRVVAALNRQGVANLLVKEDRMAARALGSTRFYYQGKPGVNFETVDDRKILLRVSPEDLDGVLEGIAQTPDHDERVALKAGPAVVRGLDDARQALAAAGYSPPSVAPPNGAARIVGGEELPDDDDERGAELPTGPPAASRDGMYAGLMQIVGLDPDLLVTEPSAGSTPEQIPDHSSDAVAIATGDGTEVGERSPLPGKKPVAGKAGPTATVGDDESAPREPASLVDRRLEALAAARRARGTEKDGESLPEAKASFREADWGPSEAAAQAAGRGPADRFVTLVIEIGVAETPVSDPVAPPAKAAPKQEGGEEPAPPQIPSPIPQ